MAKPARHLSPELEARQKEIDEEIIRENPIYFFEMNRAQRQFVRVKNPECTTPKRRLFEAGNKIGKCITYNTLIETPDGEMAVGELFERGKPFNVYAWDGKKRVIAKATAPFKKPGIHQCFRIEMSDGRWVEAADYHRVLTSSGWRPVQHLYESFLTHRQSNSESSLSVLPSGVVCLSGRQSDCRDYYSLDPRQCGGQPLMATGNAPVFVPSRGGVLQHSGLLSRLGALASKCNSIFQRASCLLSNLYAQTRNVARYVGSLSRFFCIFSQPQIHLSSIDRQLFFAELCLLQSCGEFGQRLAGGTCSDHRLAFCDTSFECGNKIISCNPIPCQEVFDLTVEKYHNYFAGGLIHHNTEQGIAEDIAHAIGFRPWLKETDPDYRIDVKVPNNGLIGCETMMHSVPEKIDPTLRRLIPKVCKPIFKPGPTGITIRVTLTYDVYGKKCGSVIHIRSYDQRPDTFEGIDFDWIHWDEPPPKDILQAAERGKIVTNAPSWFTMTPLKEPHIYDSFSLKAFTHGGDDHEIAVIRGSIWDNCRDYCRPCNLIIEENVEVRTVRRCPKCNKVMGFIPKAGIDQYLSTLDPDEREAREEGKWHHLSGLVYKDIDREQHVYNDFPIPKNWMKIESVDPHDARPVHWLFGAVSPEEIDVQGKKRHRIYWYDHLLGKGDVGEIVRQVKSKRALHGYEEPYFVVLDKKFGEKTQMEEKSWQSELERNGIHRIRLSHSSPGDVELGHKIVREYLKPQYSQLLGVPKPGMLWAKIACTGKGSPFHAMCNYQYKENRDKPEEEYKDWCDCTRYAALEQPVYKPPEDEKKVIDLITKRNSESMKMRRLNFARV